MTYFYFVCMSVLPECVCTGRAVPERVLELLEHELLRVPVGFRNPPQVFCQNSILFPTEPPLSSQ